MKTILVDATALQGSELNQNISKGSEWPNKVF